MPPHPFTTDYLRVRRNEDLLREATWSRMSGAATGDFPPFSPVINVRAFVCRLLTVFSTVRSRVRWSRRLANA
jgi:hypothetical protein